MNMNDSRSSTNSTAEPNLSPLLNALPAPRWRIVITLGIAAFLASQIWIPVTYYLSDQPTSERFAWRMFSSVDLSTWNTRVVVFVEQDGKLIERTVPVAAYLQETYVKAIQRAQFDIIEPFMQRMLAQPGVQEVRLLAQGKYPSGEAIPAIECVLRPGEAMQIVASGATKS